MREAYETYTLVVTREAYALMFLETSCGLWFRVYCLGFRDLLVMREVCALHGCIEMSQEMWVHCIYSSPASRRRGGGDQSDSERPGRKPLLALPLWVRAACKYTAIGATVQ